MRANEFITEGKMHDWHYQGIPGMKSLTGVGQFYELYRLGLAMACVGREEDSVLGDSVGVTQDNPVTLSYTQADEDIINKALQLMGKTATQITTMGSAEPTNTNSKSPVAKLGPVRRKNEQ